MWNSPYLFDGDPILSGQCVVIKRYAMVVCDGAEEVFSIHLDGNITGDVNKAIDVIERSYTFDDSWLGVLLAIKRLQERTV